MKTKTKNILARIIKLENKVAEKMPALVAHGSRTFNQREFDTALRITYAIEDASYDYVEAENEEENDTLVSTCEERMNELLAVVAADAYDEMIDAWESYKMQYRK